MKIGRRAAGFADVVHHCLAADIVQIRHHHLGAFARERRRTGGANPRCATGYDGDLALDLAHAFLLPFK